MAKKPVVLIIRDGWGINPGGKAKAQENGDATLLAQQAVAGGACEGGRPVGVLWARSGRVSVALAALVPSQMAMVKWLAEPAPGI